MGLLLNRGGKVYDFRPDTKVYEQGQSTALGAWRATATGAEAQDNGIHYTIGGAAQPFVPLQYKFNANNQLTATIPAAANGGAESAAYTFEGGISIDNNDDILYYLYNPSNTTPRPRITLYGKLKLRDDSRAIQIDLSGGGGAEIVTLYPTDWLESKPTTLAGQPGKDTLVFKTYTRNQTAGNVLSSVVFTGLWNIQDGMVVFHSKIAADLHGVKATLSLQGSVRGIAFGLEVTTGDAAGAGPTLALQIKANHKWNNGDAAWRVELGYTGQQFSTSANAQVNLTDGAGQTFTIGGNLQLTQAVGAGGATTPIQGGGLNLDLNLNVAYSLARVDNGKQLKFLAQATVMGQTVTYNLELSGKFTYRNGSLTFSLLNRNGQVSASLELMFQIEGLSLAIKVIASGTTLDVTLDFEVTLIWINGKLQPPKDARQLA